ncbi:centrosome-associated protein 350-like [Prorops nasuta]|uniref:centrosome-associated protein 350-like n=1 Tax=Prorops nasuta TaxID=863751 RepID=UPI0034CE10C0
MKSSFKREKVGDAKKKHISLSHNNNYYFTKIKSVSERFRLDTFQISETKENKAPDSLGLHSLDDILSQYPVQPHPFSFITALKHKAALKHHTGLMDNEDIPGFGEKHVHANRMSLLEFDHLSKNIVPEVNKSDIRQQKCLERVHRKLDFSLSDLSSNIGCENVEPLKAPNVSISSVLSKKKDHVKDGNREKENWSKRARSADMTRSMRMETRHELYQRSRSPKHASKGATDNISIIPSGRGKHDDRNQVKAEPFAFKTAKKISNKRVYEASPDKPNRLPKESSMESRRKADSVELPAGRTFRLGDRLSMKESSMSTTSESDNRREEDPFQIMKCTNDNILLNVDNRQVKPQTHPMSHSVGSAPFTAGEPFRRSIDKVKTVSKTEIPRHNEFDLSDDSKVCLSKFKSCSGTQSDNGTENFESIASAPSDDTGTSNNKVDGPFSSNDLLEDTFPQTLYDPRRISFREDHSHVIQDEFYDLATPDMNLVFRNKKIRHNAQSAKSDNEDCKSGYKTSTHNDQIQQSMSLVHPTALHMQFQAELHLLDSFNESLRQVMDVEKCLYSVKRKKNDDQIEDPDQSMNESSSARVPERTKFDRTVNNDQRMSQETSKLAHDSTKVVEVQTQTVNDIATQTDAQSGLNISERYKKEKDNGDDVGDCDDDDNEDDEVGKEERMDLPIATNIHNSSMGVHQLSLKSIDQVEDLDRIDDVSFPSKVRTMSEISLHETTSSIKTETGTEISISTRDLTYSFNQYLDLEIAQLIKDEKQRYDKIEMLFKSREKTLNDRTKKLVKLEEQKRALRDTGQDSRISSVKKKQRALLLKLQQEKDEMNRLKELHKIASQERKLMLQKQRNMFNPQMSTKNILTKLKRSADSQSPRRLSGPMKGYDIRSNSSMSSLIDSDKSQQESSQIQHWENDVQSEKKVYARTNRCTNLPEEAYTSLSRCDDSYEGVGDRKKMEDEYRRRLELHKDVTASYELRTHKFEEKMPKHDNYKLKSQQFDYFQTQKSGDVECMKSESDTLVEKLKRRAELFEKADKDIRTLMNTTKESDLGCVPDILGDAGSVATSTTNYRLPVKTDKPPKISSETVSANLKSLKRPDRSVDEGTRIEHGKRSQLSTRRKSSKCHTQRPKSSSDMLIENTLKAETSSSRVSGELIRHNNRGTKVEKEFIHSQRNCERAFVNGHSNSVQEKNSQLFNDVMNQVEAKENALRTNVPGGARVLPTLGRMSIKSDASDDSEIYCSKSVVVRPHNSVLKTSRKLEQILSAREAALATRKNCVEEWMAWHARLRAEEDRVMEMERAALRLVDATSNVLSYHDTTISSDTSDVEGRIELLTEKLAERRMEITRLRKESRRQAKQRLRTLEANLLNKIKRYDSTINEMRKKLDLQRGILKDSEKLAIECRSVADSKTPELPCTSDDLLLQRSRSESDLLHTSPLRRKATLRRSQEDSIVERDGDRELDPVSSKHVKSSSLIDQRFFSPESQVSKSLTKSFGTEPSAAVLVPRSSLLVSRNEENDSSSNPRVDVTRVASSAAANNYHLTMKDDNQLDRNNVVDNEALGEGMQDFCKKLDYLQFNNQNLNDDISSLEGEIKALSEIMQRLSKKPDDSRISNTSLVFDKTTARVKTSEKHLSEDRLSELARSKDEGTISNMVSDSVSDKVDTDDIRLSKHERNEEISTDIISEEISLTKSNQEMDYEARSKEILNEIEKSIISEHVKDTSTALEKSIQTLHKENEELSNDLISLESDIKSISEIILQVAKNKRDSIVLEEDEGECNIVSEISRATEAISSELSDSLSKNEDAKSMSAIDTDRPADIADNFITTEISVNTQEEDIRTDLRSSNFSRNNVVTEVSKESSPGNINESQDTDVIQTEPQASIVYNESPSELDNNSENGIVSKSHNIDEEYVDDENDDWTISDSFELKKMNYSEAVESAGEKSNECQSYTSVNEENEQMSNDKHESKVDNETGIQDKKVNISIDVEDVSMFIPKGESTNIDILEMEAEDNNNASTKSNEGNNTIGKISISEAQTLDDIDNNVKSNTVASFDNVNTISESIGLAIATPNVDEQDEKRELSLVDNNEVNTESQQFSMMINRSKLPEEINEAPEESSIATELSTEPVTSELGAVNSQENLSHPPTQVSDDLTDENAMVNESNSPKPIGLQNDLPIVAEQEPVVESEENKSECQDLDQQDRNSKSPLVRTEKPFDILRDPDYEDISEESMEVYEILDKDELEKLKRLKKTNTMLEKYEAVEKSDHVLRILDGLSQRSSDPSAVIPSHQEAKEYESNDFVELQASSGMQSNVPSSELNKQNLADYENLLASEKQDYQSDLSQLVVRERKRQGVTESIAGGAGTPINSPDLEINSSNIPCNLRKLDNQTADGDRMALNNVSDVNNELKNDFHLISLSTMSEGELEARIEKLNASMKQPGSEEQQQQPSLKTQLLLEQLQIALKIKRLEGLEWSYYIREIPNKPPPPYTPPVNGRKSSASLAVLSPPPAVVPSSIEELTAFTDKATVIIFQEKLNGKDIMSLEAPSEILELTKDNSETAKKDRRIYNTFLFGLCKEIISEVYRSEYEIPGPSWTKPNVKTKPAIKIPNTLEELNEYVAKEVATLFGFKTKLQRENMVMRWSRKRRDRVDELLAREAQAEEDEWTKFHYDELSVKNGLTVAILDTLLVETTNVIKIAFAKKREISA